MTGRLTAVAAGTVFALCGVQPAVAGPERAGQFEGASMLAAAAAYLGTSAQQADEFFNRQNADLAAVTKLEGLTADIDGVYFIRGRAIVNVTSPQAAQLARQLGLTARYAARGERDLDALRTKVWQLAAQSGVDHRGYDVVSALEAQQLVVKVARTAEGDRLTQQLTNLAGVTVERTRQPMEIVPATSGLHIGGRGMYVHGNTNFDVVRGCSQGFAGTMGGTRVMMTVGHCVEDGYLVNNIEAGPRTNDRLIGWRKYGAYFGGSRSDDVGVIQISGDATSWTSIDTHLSGYWAITGWESPRQGMTVCKSGMNSGWTCGDVVNHLPEYYVTICEDYNNDGFCDAYTPVKDLWTMTTCVDPGDSGGPIISGHLAVGLSQGKNRNAPDCGLNTVRQRESNWTSTFVSVYHLTQQAYPGLALRHS